MKVDPHQKTWRRKKENERESKDTQVTEYHRWKVHKNNVGQFDGRKGNKTQEVNVKFKSFSNFIKIWQFSKYSKIFLLYTFLVITPHSERIKFRMFTPTPVIWNRLIWTTSTCFYVFCADPAGNAIKSGPSSFVPPIWNLLKYIVEPSATAP